jgi:hypothetical protein
VHITYYIRFFLNYKIRQWRRSIYLCSESISHGDEPVKRGTETHLLPMRRPLSLIPPLKFCFTSQHPTTISGMRVLVAWWNHHLSALGIDPSCQRRSMNSVSSNPACWAGISIPIRQTLIVHCKGWCFILSLLNNGVHFSAHAVAWRERKDVGEIGSKRTDWQGVR